MTERDRILEELKRLGFRPYGGGDFSNRPDASVLSDPVYGDICYEFDYSYKKTMLSWTLSDDDISSSFYGFDKTSCYIVPVRGSVEKALSLMKEGILAALGGGLAPDDEEKKELKRRGYASYGRLEWSRGYPLGGVKIRHEEGWFAVSHACNSAELRFFRLDDLFHILEWAG